MDGRRHPLEFVLFDVDVARASLNGTHDVVACILQWAGVDLVDDL